MFCLVTGYTNVRSAVVRAIGCLQLEMDAEHDGNSGVHMYSVHPGYYHPFIIEASTERLIITIGEVKTPMTTMDGVAHPDMDKMKPGVCLYRFNFDYSRLNLLFIVQSSEGVRKNFARFGDS